ncbi:MAG: NOL1/NOP2/sun family putative RNA methylase [Candidatus Latescibacterota bacterium]|nr:NOL1/NOP2/sun family putative RNA methylase [Candidatus Latescibacterota bacterium]
MEKRREALLNHLQRLLPDPTQAADFRRAMVTQPDTAVRLNRLVPAAHSLRDSLAEIALPVAWCENAFVLPRDDSETGIGHSLEYLLGGVYIQAKATTLAVTALDPRPGELVLDLAAAPGGKATQIATAMGNSGLLMTNEPQRRRVASLVGNLQRCGVHNTVVSSTPGTMLARWLHNRFDRVLLDAPCSGDGILCKDTSMLSYWSPEDTRNMGLQQTGLLRAAFHMLRPGGRLVYSTCSLSTEENEDVVMGLWRRYPNSGRQVPLGCFSSPALPREVAASYPDDVVRYSARIWPHLHDTEGAFVAVIEKTAPTQWRPAEGDVLSGEANSSAQEEGCHRQRIQERWGIDLDVPADHRLIAVGKHLHLRPTLADPMLTELPWYVRAGMRVAGLQGDHFYLAQQALSLWGNQVVERRVEVSWDNLRTLFRGASVQLEEPASVRGEVVVTHGPWVVCRGQVSGEDQRDLEGFLPKVLRTSRLRRLCP